MEMKNTDYWFAIFMEAKKQGMELDQFELNLYIKYKNSRTPDAFDIIISIETTIHRLIKAVLIIKYRNKWWEEGIPKEIKERCSRRSREGEYDELYKNTTFGDLIYILENKEIFSN